jgi:hydroxymethylpyrimidine kinase/phosphomethylpyrimidine kinase
VSAPVVCSIGTTDPWNAAGVGLDARIVGQRGGRAVTVVAAVSAQDASGLHALLPIAPATIAAQFASLRDARIAAVRVGALAGADAVVAVADLLAGLGVPVVYDPAFGPSAGGRFADAATVAAVRAHLLRVVTVCTPNLAEAAELTQRTQLVDEADMAAAGAALRALGCDAALVTGGHLAGDPVDVLADAQGVARYAAARIPIQMRGTGCVLAAALAVELARGVALRTAIETARDFVRTKIAAAVRAGDFFIAE